jgi:hypothetical protein
MLSFDIKKGAVVFEKTPFDCGEMDFNFNEFTIKSSELAWKKSKNSFAAKTEFCEFLVNLQKESFSVAVKNISKKKLFLKDISIFFCPAGQKKTLAAQEWMEYINSFSFEEKSGVKIVGLANRCMDSNPSSSFAYLISKRSDMSSYMFAVLPPHKGDYIRFKACHDSPHFEGNFGLSISSEQERELAPKAKIETSSVLVKAGDDPFGLFDELADIWKKKIKKPLKDVKFGWNSWDYFAGAVDAEDIYKNQKASKKLFGKKINYFVIDEGYEPRWGIWEANWKFPKGLKDYCKKIKAGGGVPGIWTSALLVNTYTTMYRENPHWFAKDADGGISTKLFSYGPMAYLDPTHPEVEKFLFETFSRLRKEGFEYFKVDFTQQVLNAKLFHDRKVPRGNIIRKAFEIIRRAIGDDAYLLACGAPYESVTDVVDASRSTGDIHNFWGHVLRNASSMSTKWWMHRTLWNNDPDFLIVRNPETCTLPRMNREYKPTPFTWENTWLTGKEMNTKEIMAYALLVYLSAGDIMLGDDLCSLNKKGAELIKKVIERPLTKAAVPVDIFESHEGLPSIWKAEEKDFSVIGVFNWEEDESEFVIDVSEYSLKKSSKVKTFFGDEEIMPEDGAISLLMPPRSGEALIISN